MGGWRGRWSTGTTIRFECRGTHSGEVAVWFSSSWVRMVGWKRWCGEGSRSSSQILRASDTISRGPIRRTDSDLRSA